MAETKTRKKLFTSPVDMPSTAFRRLPMLRYSQSGPSDPCLKLAANRPRARRCLKAANTCRLCEFGSQPNAITRPHRWTTAAVPARLCLSVPGKRDVAEIVILLHSHVPPPNSHACSRLLRLVRHSARTKCVPINSTSANTQPCSRSTPRTVLIVKFGRTHPQRIEYASAVECTCVPHLRRPHQSGSASRWAVYSSAQHWMTNQRKSVKHRVNPITDD